MALGDYSIENVTTRSGHNLRLGPVAVDLISDIAVLGSLDDEAFLSDSLAFERWCDATPAVPLVSKPPRLDLPRRSHILTQSGNWIGAKVIRRGSPGPFRSGSLSIEADDPIEGGTSGGPVVDSWGRLVGVVSQFDEVAAGEKSIGVLPIANLALPRWVWEFIEAAC